MGHTPRKRLITGLVMVTVMGVAAGLYWFQPWKLWQDRTVTESLPGTVVETSPLPEATPEADAGAADAGASTAGASPSPSAPSGPLTVASGGLISHEHTTTGTAKLVRLADGTHVVRLEHLDTSNGPDLRVWLTDAPVKEGRAGWHVFDDGAYVSLGRLKGNKGSQNYPLPDDVDPSAYTSVTIWCDRFDVSFGAAELTAT
ncbi:DM13 domain-containing protein [Streptomyces sp. LBUM 1478]|uniref:DM13 domain-containing protein n=1 Tax=Streptomyces scabiei TaxID=1930 RepID=UPI000765E458|nr:DM13 domain-containing protein [Streptomyces scabiei]MBP5910290.1 DM13 domain-containing protein [Streptomyces sp. LBUM 1478]MBP5934482.1 DM13 domain-containing protein [Streptomyces sp. LBUM 1479]MDX2536167.1 DM13 domain-containing protein [Streptomyces scabiei]MDX2797366.1 DM13 domain-containing protein [Streptomyces scabiei]MDX2855817.1 DM13 domain-containing protein [Streptomyces scabiei]